VSTTRERILAAATQLFAERGYASVTIRQIATEADVSPALVMKQFGTKEAVYALAAPPEPEPFPPDLSSGDLGVTLVRRVLDRRDSGATEPLLHALLAVVDAADPSAARQAFEDRYVAGLQARIHGDRRTAEVVLAMLIGLASAVRPLRLLRDDRDGLVEHYGALIQAVVDQAADRGPSPERGTPVGSAADYAETASA
jgi:AcrR family transcriptional regulator